MCYQLGFGFVLMLYHLLMRTFFFERPADENIMVGTHSIE